MKIKLQTLTANLGKKKPFCRVTAVVALISLLILVWTFWPRPLEKDTFSLSALYLEGGQVEVEWPAALRLGQADWFILSVNTSELDIALETEDGMVVVPLSDLEDDFSPVFEARLELLESIVTPGGSVRVSFSPGQQVEYAWLIRPHSRGLLGGRLWLYLDLVPENDEEETVVRYPVLARPLEIESQAPFGLSIWGLRGLCGLMMIISVLLLMTRWRSSRK